MSDGCVISRFKILAYYRVRFAFEAAQGLPSNITTLNPGLTQQTEFVKAPPIINSATGGLGFVTLFWKVVRKIILKILPASPKL